MKIKDKEINLKITPRAIEKAESKSNLDILDILRGVTEEREPRASDYYKLIYAGYLGATNEDISYEEFLDILEKEDISFYELSYIGVNLLTKRKN